MRSQNHSDLELARLELARLRRARQRLSSLSLVFMILACSSLLLTAYLMLHGWLTGAGGYVMTVSLMFTWRHFKWRINRLRSAAMRIEGRQDNRPPILVLRSFTEGSLTFRPGKLYKDAIEPGRSYLNDLALAVCNLGQPIAIGAPGTVITEAFARQDLLYFQSDESCWHLMFDFAAKAARAIILIPETTPNLLWEVRALVRSGCLSKAILFMPPTPTGAIRWIAAYNRPTDIAVKWAHARAAWNKIGLELPAYQKSGMLFALGSDGDVQERCDLNGFVEALDLAPVRDLVERVAGSSTPLRELIPRLEPLEIPPHRPGILRQVVELIFLGR